MDELTRHEHPLPELGNEHALFLDVDGTLVDLAAHPDAVVLQHDMVTVLSLAERLLGGALALVSGRSIRDVDRLVAPLVLPVAGQHGAERRDIARRYIHQDSMVAALDPFREALAELHRALPPLFIEDKGMSIAVHYRNAPDLADRVRAEIDRLMAHSGIGLAVQAGKMVLEIKHAGHHKGTAIGEFLGERPFAGRQPVFVGDDVTDEDGFRVVNERGGISVKVGEGPTQAHLRATGPDQIRHWLREQVARIDQS
ncbi:MAG: trehalose-phosphatase [Pseudomonadota bacterium]|nr:trehalose-phosphatase [Pseudomonadota bacterium]